jgi:hypothetical protein
MNLSVIPRSEATRNPFRISVGFLAALGMTFPSCHSEEQMISGSRFEISRLPVAQRPPQPTVKE